MGCPDDRRYHKVPRLRRGHNKTQEDSSFSLFHILDINIGSTQPKPEDDDFSDDEEDEEEEATSTNVAQESIAIESLPPPPAYSVTAANSTGAPSIFDALFAASDARQKEKDAEVTSAPLAFEAKPQVIPLSF